MSLDTLLDVSRAGAETRIKIQYLPPSHTVAPAMDGLRALFWFFGGLVGASSGDAAAL